ncbi:MAG: MMPL family transporter [Methanomassiliicoccales archaeon]
MNRLISNPDIPGEGGRGDMSAFRKLGEFIAKHHKGIIIFWIVLVIIAAPLAPRVLDAVQYDMMEMAPDDMESEEAKEYIDGNFNTSASSASTIVVFKGQGNDSVMGEGLKKEILNLSSDLSDDRGLPNLTVLSVYTPLLDNYTEIVLKGVVEMSDLVNGTSMLLFDIPSQYPELWNTTFASGLMLYGATDAHTLNWEMASRAHPGWNTTQLDEFAYQVTREELEVALEEANVTEEMEGLAWIWYDEFSDSWNSTSDDPYMQANPFARDRHAIDDAFPEFWENARAYITERDEGMWEYASPILNRTESMLDPLDFADPYRINDICHSVVDDLIAPYLKHIPEEYSRSIEAYIEGFNQRWDDNTTASVSGNWTMHIPPDMGQVREFVDQLVPTLESSLPPDGESMVKLVYAMGWDRWDDPSQFNETVVDLVRSTMGEVDVQLIRDTLALGSRVSDRQLRERAHGIMLNNSLADYPIPVPEEVLRMLINSPANDTMLLTIDYSQGVVGQNQVPQVREIVGQLDLPGIEVYVSGTDAIDYDIMSSSMEDMEHIDPVSVTLVVILIGLFFRSLVSSVVPPSIIGMALVLAFAGIFLVASLVMQVTNYVLVLVMVSMLGAGSDYGIFILSRYREERMQGKDRRESMLESVTWAGESITTSGFTVMVGFGVLSLSSFSMVSSIGVSLAMGIFVALMFALTFLPSLIMLIGDRIFWPSSIESFGRSGSNILDRVSHQARRYFERTARVSIKYAKVIVIAAILVSVPAVYMVSTMSTSYDMIGTMPDSSSKTGVQEISQGFGGGKIDPVMIALEMDGQVYNGTSMNITQVDPKQVAEKVEGLNMSSSFNLTKFDVIEGVCQDIESKDNIREVTSPSRPFGDPIEYRNMSQYTVLERAEYYVAILEYLSHEGDGVLIEVTMQDQPFAAKSIDTVNGLREMMGEQVEDHGSIQAIHLGGGTALMYDISSLVSSEFDLIEMMAILLIFLILLVVLRAVFTPVRSIVTILMSIVWTLALTSVIFGNVLNEPLLWLMPIVLFVVCLGLGMDYDIFLTTRIREEVHRGKSTDQAIVDSVKATGGIITICGLIMAGAFGTMTLSGSVMLQEFGFALAFAILLDATVVRMYLVPAIMSLMGRWNWWAPRWRRGAREDSEEEE